MATKASSKTADSAGENQKRRKFLGLATISLKGAVVWNVGDATTLISGVSESGIVKSIQEFVFPPTALPFLPPTIHHIIANGIVGAIAAPIATRAGYVIATCPVFPWLGGKVEAGVKIKGVRAGIRALSARLAARLEATRNEEGPSLVVNLGQNMLMFGMTGIRAPDWCGPAETIRHPEINKKFVKSLDPGKLSPAQQESVVSECGRNLDKASRELQKAFRELRKACQRFHESRQALPILESELPKAKEAEKRAIVELVTAKSNMTNASLEFTIKEARYKRIRGFEFIRAQDESRSKAALVVVSREGALIEDQTLEAQRKLNLAEEKLTEAHLNFDWAKSRREAIENGIRDRRLELGALKATGESEVTSAKKRILEAAQEVRRAQVAEKRAREVLNCAVRAFPGREGQERARSEKFRLKFRGASNRIRGIAKRIVTGKLVGSYKQHGRKLRGEYLQAVAGVRSARRELREEKLQLDVVKALQARFLKLFPGDPDRTAFAQDLTITATLVEAKSKALEASIAKEKLAAIRCQVWARLPKSTAFAVANQGSVDPEELSEHLPEKLREGAQNERALCEYYQVQTQQLVRRRGRQSGRETTGNGRLLLAGPRSGRGKC